jgi:thioredoxin-like negative regulator of GroEL
MSNDKAKSGTPPLGPKGAVISAPATNPPPLFRRIDWITFAITFAAMCIGYYLTLAPEQTLEDSGELAVGSYYAGIPHPPGYPVWTLYTWMWTVLVPFGNIAWRVGLGTATGSALAAGLLGLLVSRGSSLLMEGIEELKAMGGKWENAICVVSGVVAGTLIGFNGFLWSQSVIVEVYAFSVMSFMVVLLCMLRWIYAPHQRRYLYYAMFAFGISFTNHQTLILAAMGIEVAIAAADFRLGRNLFLGNSIIYLAGLILKAQQKLGALEANPAIFAIFNVVGIASIAAYVWFAYMTRPNIREYMRDGLLAAAVLAAAAAPKIGFFGWAIFAGALIGFAKVAWETRKADPEWRVMMYSGLCWLGGASLYFYMPLAGMTNPPMQWGYPRTVEGFWHAFTRGQYEKANPTDIIGDPGRFITQLQMLGRGIIEEFNWVYAFLALVPFLFFLRLHRRERSWLVGITAIYLCLGVLLLIMLNPPPDRAAQDLVRVFFGASHTLIALMVGYGMTLVAAYMATHYQSFRPLGLLGGGFALALALYSFVTLTSTYYFGETANVSLSQLLSLTGAAFTDPHQFSPPIFAGLILIGSAAAFVIALIVYRTRGPLLITLGLFALMPLYPIMTHWAENEQRNHWFGYWFGHDMFTPPFEGEGGKPLYPEMARNAVLYGGTDPGRFCPTYSIFAGSFLDPKDAPAMDPHFDRRDVYIITQNALADGTYLNYIRAHYNRSKQIDPPFFQEFFRSENERFDNYQTNAVARAVQPLDRLFTFVGDRVEMRRRTFTSWFSDDHFADLPALAARLKPGGEQDAVSKYVYNHLSDGTKELLNATGNESRLRRALSRELNKLLGLELENREKIRKLRATKSELEEEIAMGKGSAKKEARIQQLNKEIEELGKVPSLYTPERFQGVEISEYLQDFIRQNPVGRTRVRLNRLLLEAAYPKEIIRTKGGVYPDREIHIATPQESAKSFQEYLADAQRRMELGQLKPMEQVTPGEDGRIQVSGQVAVMAINGLLTKVMFDANPKNEFYVEESFPLDWMYPHLTPFGIIMKINRQPLTEIPEEVVRTDHEFWTRYSTRLIGNWITYDTTVQEIADFVEQVYLRRNFKGFTGDRKFVRDDQAQKAFSKLRSSIGGVYNWRIANSKPGPEQQRMIKEADFAFRQAFAFCPYSPEAVFRYVNLLLSMQRFDDALIIARTCQKLDPNNGQVVDLVKRLEKWKSETQSGNIPGVGNIQELEKQYQDEPTNFQAGFNLAMAYLQLQQMPRALQVLDDIARHPNAQAASAAQRALMQAFSSMGQTGRVQQIVDTLEARVKGSPDDLDMALVLAEGYRTLQNRERAMQVLDAILNHPKLDPNTVLQLAQHYAAYVDYGRLEQALGKLVQLSPESPEAWYDFAAIKAHIGKVSEAVDSLRRSIELSNKRRQKDPGARDMAAEAKKDPRFAALRQDPTFRKITGG